MSNFDETQWVDPAFSREYLENADHFIPERYQLFNALCSFYDQFVAREMPVTVCDLGCGDGVLTQQLLRAGHTPRVTLLDGSTEMLQAARTRLKGQKDLNFEQQSFQELISHPSHNARFNFVMSAFAIHHLTGPERALLFAVIWQLLEPGGFFLNIDVVLPDDAALEEWYYVYWRQWIAARVSRYGLSPALTEVPQQARSNPDNKYGSLSGQLHALVAAQFTAVECHYRNGLFGLYSGRKASWP